MKWLPVVSLTDSAFLVNNAGRLLYFESTHHSTIISRLMKNSPVFLKQDESALHNKPTRNAS